LAGDILCANVELWARDLTR